MNEIEKRQKKPKKAEATEFEEYLKQLPPPPQEHAHELKMEKRLKRMLEEQKKKRAKKLFMAFPMIPKNNRELDSPMMEIIQKEEKECLYALLIRWYVQERIIANLGRRVLRT